MNKKNWADDIETLFLNLCILVKIGFSFLIYCFQDNNI